MQYIILHCTVVCTPFSDGKNCKTCDRVSSILETKKPDLEEVGVKVVRIADKKMAKQSGVLTFPAISFFKAGKVHNFEGGGKKEPICMQF